MKATDKILEKLKREGSVTAKALSEELGMTSMGARQHLQTLEELQLVTFYDVKAKVGRPTRHWRLSAKGHQHFPDHHSDLTIQLFDAVDNLYGQQGLEKVTQEREKNTFERYQKVLVTQTTLEDKLSQLTDLRANEGYMAELTKTEDGYLLIENHCPICQAAQRCPSLCQSELNIFEKLLGDKCVISRTEHIINNERRCVYQITCK